MVSREKEVTKYKKSDETDKKDIINKIEISKVRCKEKIKLKGNQ